MTTLEYILQQGIPQGAAEELAERAEKNPSLASCIHRGKFVRLRPIKKHEIDRVNAMLETGVGPALMTDSVFLQGHCNGNQFGEGKMFSERDGDKLKALCEAQGGSTTGRVYKSQLCRPGRPGDPRAWISGRGDVERVCKANKADCDGGVTVKAKPIEIEPPKPIPVADHLVHAEAARLLEGQVITVKQYRRKFAEVREKITPLAKRKYL